MKQIISIISLLFSAITFAQNVGIGEAAPTAAKLQVKASDSAVLLVHNATSTGTNIKTGLFFKTGNSYSGSIATIGSGSSYRLGLFTPASRTPFSLIERITILDVGRTGIGTINPQATLHVSSVDSAVGIFQNNKVLADNVKTGLFFSTGPAGNSYFTGAIKTIGETYNEARIGFFTRASADITDLTERLTIADAGNIGIGNTSPAYQLDVTGNLRTSANAVIGTTLNVGGLLSANAIQSANSVNAKNINTTGNAGIGGTLTVDNAVYAGGNIATNYNLNVGGVATVNNLTVTGAAQVGGGLGANTLSLTGNTTAGATLSVVGQSDFNSIKITGGGPGVNKILASANTSGDAVWANSAIGSGFSAYAEYAMLPKSQDLIIPFSTSGSGNYNDEGSFSNTNRRFVAPAAGLYHFDLNLEFDIGYGDLYYGYYPDGPGYVIVSARINGNKSIIYKAQEYIAQGLNNEVLQPGFGSINLSFTLKMGVNEYVDFLVNQSLVATTPTNTKNVRIRSYLQGYRIY